MFSKVKVDEDKNIKPHQETNHEFKNIDLTKPTLSPMTKINHIEKIDNIQPQSGSGKIEEQYMKVKEITIEPNTILSKVSSHHIETVYDKKPSEQKTLTKPVSNPFLKNIRHTKFIKKNSDKNNSFYKKKYEENSANFHSVSESVKDENSIIQSTIQTTINEIKDTQNSLKIIKNKIMLKEASSDEESDNEINL